jgi:two-component system sensor histidine kinase KdpD
VTQIAQRFLLKTLHADSVLMLAGSDGALASLQSPALPALSLEMARAALKNGACADLDARPPVGYFPLKAPARVRGVLALAFADAGAAGLQEHHELLEAVASLVAIAVERIHYVDVANNSRLQMVSERLRSSILSAVSHDLRTPLTALVGLADSLARARPPLAGQQRESAEAIRSQAIRLSGLVANLLDMARLNAGEVKLRREWQPLEEVIGASIKALEQFLLDHPVRVSLAANLPLLEFDAVLIERVFCNLLENAAKYSPAGSAIEVTASCIDSKVRITVCDEGRGISRDHAETIFEMFVRGERESATPGVGLGLAICRAIVEAHGGSISAGNRPGGGAAIAFTLPIGNPPVIADEAAAQGSADA